jgi:outer membrane protein
VSFAQTNNPVPKSVDASVDAPIAGVIEYEAPSNVPDGLPDHLVGDLGFGMYNSNMAIGAIGPQNFFVPYAFFDYKRFFARLDTFGIKTVKLGYGYLEVAGQVNLDNYNRKSTINGNTYSKLNPIPIGIGTFQDTPIGGFFLHGYQDVNRSQGQIYQFSYFAELEIVNHIKLYPELGAELLSQSYANYYYGVSAAASRTLGYSQYTVPTTTNLVTGLLVEVPLVDQWYFNLYGRLKFLGSGISSSPIMNRATQDSIFGAVVYRFE